MPYLVAYRYRDSDDISFYRFTADDAEHAVEQFRDAEPDKMITVIFVVLA